ncbi:hypothetical protein MACH05_18410 [Qipengyuania nanhaisediminis]
MRSDELVVSGGTITSLHAIANRFSVGLAMLALSVWALYSTLEPYQKDRLQDVALIHLLAMAPAGTLEPYQEERLQDALTFED